MEKMKVVIIGAGIGGLVCAIACRREGLDVVVLERVLQISSIGAGIQIPPNASRVLREYGILPNLLEKGVTIHSLDLRRYADGSMLRASPGLGESLSELFGAPWITIHRAEYHKVLWDAAARAGVVLRLGAEVEHVKSDESRVTLKGGEAVEGDVIVGADGLWSRTRDVLLGIPSPPVETGDLAYRGTFTLAQLRGLNDPRVDQLCSGRSLTLWLGPDRHSVFYPLRDGQEFNLVLLRPDNLPAGVRTAEGDLGEMIASFEGWDDILLKIISCLPSVLKWKLCHHHELRAWTKGSVVLLGDACHPTLPYQAQGAAMAVEDGAVLAKLLGLLCRSSNGMEEAKRRVPEIGNLYESLRKSRTTFIVQGATANRKFYHLSDGAEQEAQDAALGAPDGAWRTGHEWKFADREDQTALWSFDSVEDCEKAFQVWFSSASRDPTRDAGAIDGKSSTNREGHPAVAI